MDKLPSFEYFPNPVEHVGTFERSDEACLCCGLSPGWIYCGTISGHRDDDPRVCSECVASGAASRAWEGGSFNTIVNDVPESVREAVECRTPHLITWQDLFWPTCCDDACVFRGQAQYERLTTEWPEAGEALRRVFEPGLLGAETFEEFLECFKSECDPGCYAFQCRRCGGWKVEWDVS